MSRSATLTLIGFVLFFTGFLSLILRLVGMHFSFLAWMGGLGEPLATILRVSLILFGMVLIYSGRTSVQD